MRLGLVHDNLYILSVCRSVWPSLLCFTDIDTYFVIECVWMLVLCSVSQFIPPNPLPPSDHVGAWLLPQSCTIGQSLHSFRWVGHYVIVTWPSLTSSPTRQQFSDSKPCHHARCISDFFHVPFYPLFSQVLPQTSQVSQLSTVYRRLPASYIIAPFISSGPLTYLLASYTFTCYKL